MSPWRTSQPWGRKVATRQGKRSTGGIPSMRVYPKNYSVKQVADMLDVQKDWIRHRVNGLTTKVIRSRSGRIWLSVENVNELKKVYEIEKVRRRACLEQRKKNFRNGKVTMSLRMTLEQGIELQMLAKRAGMSRQDYVKRLLQNEMERMAEEQC